MQKHGTFKETVQIRGMHCHSCEILIEDELSKIPGVERAVVSQSKGTADLYYRGSLDTGRVETAVEQAGYTLGSDERPWLSSDLQIYIDVAKAALVLFAFYLAANIFGVFDLASSAGGSYSNLSVVFLVGLTAGISTCMALVGGLVLSVSARFAEKHPSITTVDKFKPHLFFNLGRIISFFILGGVVGYAGSLLQFSVSTLGLMTIGVGIVMLTLGLQLLEISPRISKFNFTLPKSLNRLLGIKQSADREYSHRNSVVLGALTFFLPCGFTQAMQLYAMSTGSVAAGALTMGIFALGTAPGLLGVGGLTSIIKGAPSKLFFKAVGLAVVALSFYNISNGYNLSGLDLGQYSPIEINIVGTSQTDNGSGAFGSGCGGTGGGCGGRQAGAGNGTIADAQVEGNIQVLKATFSNNEGMVPANFNVNSGQPVRLEVTAKEDGYGCMGSIAVPKFSRKVEVFQKGKTSIFEFTPSSPGRYQITCAMGVPHGDLIVK